MPKIIGIRHEDKYVMERRVALIPAHLKKLITQQGLSVHVESSEKRIFSDAEFENAGASIVSKLEIPDIIFGVKEMPAAFFKENKTYVFFSHVIKGQSYNMPMLNDLMQKGCNLIDYEKVEDSEGKRLIFFGRFAGLAGMINSFWSLGQRLRVKGIETPFTRLKQSHKYNSLEEAIEIISEIGHSIAENGLPKEISPLVIGFTGYGNVSNGAQEIAALLPIKEIAPNELADLKNRKGLPQNVVYKVVFKEEDMVVPVGSNQEFELYDYYNHPEKYKGVFEQYLPHLSVLMNCMYWDDRYPRIVTKEYLKQAFSGGDPKMVVIGDVTCDPDGSIECTHTGTEIEDPVFVYDPETDTPMMGFEGNGILVMAVDILPSELPRESSIAFSNALWKYVVPIAETNFDVPFEDLKLPNPIKKAMIVHKGELTPNYKYLEEFLKI